MPIHEDWPEDHTDVQAARQTLGDFIHADAQAAEEGTDGAIYLRRYHEQFCNDRIRELKRERGYPVHDRDFVLPWIAAAAERNR